MPTVKRKGAGGKPAGRWITTDEGEHVFIGSHGEFQPHGPGSKPIATKVRGAAEVVAKARAAKPPREQRIKELASKAERIALARNDRFAAKAMTADRLKGTASKGVLNTATAEADSAKLAAIHARRRANALYKQASTAPAPKPPEPATIGHKPGESFSLLQRSAAGSKGAESTGGKTKFMFDMKKGDKPGQTSIFDKVGTVATHPVAAAPAKPAGGGFQLRGGPAAAPAQSKLGLKPAAAQGRLFDTGKPEAKGGTYTEKLQAARHAAPGQSIGIKPIQQTPREAMAAARMKTAERLRTAKQVTDVQAHPETHAKPGDVVNMKVGAIHFDPERFQYKLSGSGEHGVSTQLHQVKNWNPESAGVISVWKDPANGQTYVINGHHRLDLAGRLGVDKVTVRFIDAADDKTARMKGAITNIAEGRGTAIDAGKFFRDAGIGKEAMHVHGIPMTEATARHGLNLAGLEKGIFDKVVKQEIPIERASIIGGSGLAHEHQSSVLEQATKMRANNDTLKELIDNAKHAPTLTQRGRSLFGDTEDEVSLAGHRATAQAHIARSLASDQSLFGKVSKSKAAQALEERGRSHIDVAETGKVSAEAAQVMGVFHTLKNRGGPVSAELNRAAERLHAGEDKDKVLAETRRAVTGHVKKLLDGGAGAFD